MLKFDTDDITERIIELVEEHSSRFIEVSHRIHYYAELGYEEYKSSDLLTGELRDYGFEVENPVAGLETAFKA
ncbi:MAG: hypothetical protein ACLFVP_05270 [Candidatus Bathyarchaeia archaeon]